MAALLEGVNMSVNLFVVTCVLRVHMQPFGSRTETFTYQAWSQNCEKRLLTSSCPSVRMEQLGRH